MTKKPAELISEATEELRDLLDATRRAMGYSPVKPGLTSVKPGLTSGVVNFHPLGDPAAVVEMLEWLNRDSSLFARYTMGGQPTLYRSAMLSAWVVQWKWRGDVYESMAQGATVNAALCRAVVAVSARLAAAAAESEAV